MRTITILLLSVFSLVALAQEKTQKPKVNLYGFVRNDVIYDSRQNYEALDGEYILLPKAPNLDENDVDINAQSSIRAVNIMSRLGVKVGGVSVLNADVTGLIEFDAAASSASGGTNELRFRHAYSKMAWEKTSVLLGTTWHPLFVESCFPIMINANTGVPFQPFNRMPQLRVTHQLNNSFSVLAAASYQAQYESNGPDGPSSKYQRNAMVPNMDVQLSYSNKVIKLGIGYDYKMIQPYMSTTGTGGDFVSDETLSSNAYITYVTAKKGNWTFRAKGVYGENMYDQLLPGGYAAYEVDAVTGAEKFTNSKIVTSFVQTAYDKGRFNVSLFGGYMKNLGFDENPLSADYMYTRTPDVDEAWRIATTLKYKVNSFQFHLEHEATTAYYGDIDYSDKGKVKNAEAVSNHRIVLGTCFFF